MKTRNPGSGRFSETKPVKHGIQYTHVSPHNNATLLHAT
jgi:hypothetical protein